MPKPVADVDLGLVDRSFEPIPRTASRCSSAARRLLPAARPRATRCGREAHTDGLCHVRHQLIWRGWSRQTSSGRVFSVGRWERLLRALEACARTSFGVPRFPRLATAAERDQRRAPGSAAGRSASGRLGDAAARATRQSCPRANRSSMREGPAAGTPARSCRHCRSMRTSFVAIQRAESDLVGRYVLLDELPGNAAHSSGPRWATLERCVKRVVSPSLHGAVRPRAATSCQLKIGISSLTLSGATPSARALASRINSSMMMSRVVQDRFRAMSPGRRERSLRRGPRSPTRARRTRVEKKSFQLSMSLPPWAWIRHGSGRRWHRAATMIVPGLEVPSQGLIGWIRTGADLRPHRVAGSRGSSASSSPRMTTRGQVFG